MRIVSLFLPRLRTVCAVFRNKKELLSTKSSFFVIQAAGLAYHRARSAVHIISPRGAVSHHALACIPPAA